MWKTKKTALAACVLNLNCTYIIEPNSHFVKILLVLRSQEEIPMGIMSWLFNKENVLHDRNIFIGKLLRETGTVELSVEIKHDPHVDQLYLYYSFVSREGRRVIYKAGGTWSGQVSHRWEAAWKEAAGLARSGASDIIRQIPQTIRVRVGGYDQPGSDVVVFPHPPTLSVTYPSEEARHWLWSRLGVQKKASKPAVNAVTSSVT